MSTSSIILVCIIGLFGGGAAFRQIRIAYLQLVAEREAFSQAWSRFAKLDEVEKHSLERLVKEGTIDQDSTPHDRHKKLLDSGFALRDGTSGRFFLMAGSQPLVSRLVKEWRESAAKS